VSAFSDDFFGFDKGELEAALSEAPTHLDTLFSDDEFVYVSFERNPCENAYRVVMKARAAVFIPAHRLVDLMFWDPLLCHLLCSMDDFELDVMAGDMC
jgi:hypothetical protein